MVKQLEDAVKVISREKLRLIQEEENQDSNIVVSTSEAR
jgi:hypothetical protein